jgi:hypothetical protein
MANCNNLFKEFKKSISVDSDKNSKMTKSKTLLRDKIRKWFRENQPEYIPKFYIQGSYKMKTNIRTKDDICDLDDGVYFFRTPGVSATTLQKWVHQAVNGHTTTPSEHRKKCIRTIFFFALIARMVIAKPLGILFLTLSHQAFKYLTVEIILPASSLFELNQSTTAFGSLPSNPLSLTAI